MSQQVIKASASSASKKSKLNLQQEELFKKYEKGQTEYSVIAAHSYIIVKLPLEKAGTVFISPITKDSDGGIIYHLTADNAVVVENLLDSERQAALNYICYY